MQTFPAPQGSPYPHVGPNYQKHGEMPGYVYDPFTDRYRPKKSTLQGMGLIPKDPKEPSMVSTLAPLVGGAAALEVGKQIGTGSIFGKGGLLGTDGLGGLLGSGGGGATGTTTAGTTATTAGTTGGAGLGVGGSLGTAGTLGLGAAAALAAAHLYNQGGKEVLSGEGKTKDYVDLGVSANPFTFWVNPVLDAFGLDSVGRMLGGKSTKDYQKERWGALSPAAQGLYQANHPDKDDGIWDTGKYAGEKWTFDKALDLAKEDPTHFVGVLGNLEAFGDKWLEAPPEVQKKTVSALVDKGLYTSDKGDVLIKDKDEARKIFEAALKGEDPLKGQIKQGIEEEETGVVDPATGILFRSSSINTI